MTTSIKAHRFCKAEPLGRLPVPDLRLEFTEQIPSHLHGKELERHYREQAREIVGLLRESLPGGSMDALLVELLETKVSLLRVPE